MATGHEVVSRVSAKLSGRILYVVNSAEFFLSHRLPIALAARRAGAEVHVATPISAAVAKILTYGFAHHPISLDRRGANPWREVGSVLALVRLFQRVRPDLVHTVTIKPVLYGGIAARVAGVPALVSAVTGLGHVFVARGAAAALRRRLVRTVYRLALGHLHSRTILQNPEDQAQFVAWRLADGDQAVLIRGSGVDVTEFVPHLEPDGKPVVILASRMLWSKGVGDFIEAVGILRSEGTGARFVLVGDSDPGNPQAVPRQQLRAWDDGGVVEWWGQQEEMPSVFAKAQVVCLPTRYGEGVPKVLIEAAACGRPLVATDMPGCREIVRPQVNGILVPPGDTEALGAALRALIEDTELRRAMGLRGREIAEAEFSVEKVVRETLVLYRELMA